MASDSGIESNSSPEVGEDHPISRTHQYRKVMKPLLERKRRARINSCLDELKDLMVFALQTEGESISKLEKADVLELTVKHLRKLKQQGMLGLGPAHHTERYRAGYSAAAVEAARWVQAGQVGLQPGVGSRLVQHLARTLHSLQPRLASPPPAPHILSPASLEALRFSLSCPTADPPSSAQPPEEQAWRPW